MWQLFIFIMHMMIFEYEYSIYRCANEVPSWKRTFDADIYIRHANTIMWSRFLSRTHVFVETVCWLFKKCLIPILNPFGHRHRLRGVRTVGDSQGLGGPQACHRPILIGILFTSRVGGVSVRWATELCFFGFRVSISVEWFSHWSRWVVFLSTAVILMHYFIWVSCDLRHGMMLMSG